MAINLKISKSWNELNARQLKKIAWGFFSQKGEDLDVLIYFALIDLRPFQLLKHLKAVRVLRYVPLSTLKKYYSWVYKTTNLTTFIPSINLNNKIIYSPGDRLNNITIHEFSVALDLYLGWKKTKDIDYLFYLTAVLFRELDPSKLRVPFVKDQLEIRYKEVSRIDPKTVLAVCLSFEGCLYHITNKFPSVFPIDPKSKSKSTPSNSGFGHLILFSAGKKFGNHNETKNTNVYTFLTDFSEQLKKSPYA